MGLRDRLRKMSSTSELHDAKLANRFGSVACLPIGEVEARKRATVGGEVKRMRSVPRSGSPAFEVMISDGTGEVVAVFVGRRAIAGIEIGGHLMIEGVPRSEQNRLVMVNPAYTLLEK
jgi:RecG-like helicase